MTSPFTFPGGSALPFQKIISGTSPTIITLGQGNGAFNVVWMRCNEYAGGVAALTVELFDVANTVGYYLGSGGFTWNAKALTALQSVLFDDGIPIATGFQLRVTASIANNVLVTGAYVSKQSSSGANWRPGGGS